MTTSRRIVPAPWVGKVERVQPLRELLAAVFLQ
jgi:hypothetical protein